jgi:hypothetical protein
MYPLPQIESLGGVKADVSSAAALLEFLRERGRTSEVPPYKRSLEPEAPLRKRTFQLKADRHNNLSSIHALFAMVQGLEKTNCTSYCGENALRFTPSDCHPHILHRRVVEG